MIININSSLGVYKTIREKAQQLIADIYRNGVVLGGVLTTPMVTATPVYAGHFEFSCHDLDPRMRRELRICAERTLR